MSYKIPSDCIKLETADPFVESFHKQTDDGLVRINIWSNSRNPYYTVGTYLHHPKKGKTQLFRKFITDKEVEKILENPRLHTKKGYSTK